MCKIPNIPYFRPCHSDPKNNMINSRQKISPSRLNQLMNMAKFGWWKADFHDKCYLCSDYIIRLLGLDSDILTFEEFRLLIREDSRQRITEEFASIKVEDVYEQTFPLQTQYGELWIHSQLGAKEMDEKGHLIAWGYLQCITDPQEIRTEKALEKFNVHLHQQNNISRSLLSFLQTEDTDEVIYKILQNLLVQFQGSRAYIIEFDWENMLQNCTFEVNAPGVEPQQDLLMNFSMNSTPWWTQQISTHKPILLFSLDELPKEAQSEKELLAVQGIKSLMVIPMVAQDKVWGYMGIDIVNQYRNWSHEDYQWFATLGNIISICMELHRAKNKAQREQEYFRNLYEYMPVGYIRMQLLYDESGLPYDYRFTDLNPAFEMITGRPVNEYIGKTARELQIPDDIDKHLKEMEQIRRKETFTQINYNAHSRNQYYRCIVYPSGEDEIITLFSDITDVQKAHEALDRSEKELRNIYKNIPVGIEIYDKDGYLRDMNNKDMEIFGLANKAHGLGVNLFDNPNIPEEVKTQIREQKNVDFQIKYDFSNIHQYYSSEQQGVKDLIVKLSLLYNSKNELENYMLIIIDNTETSTAYSKIQEFENFFSVIADFAKVGYFKWNLSTRTGFALNQWFKNWGEPEDVRLEDVVGHYQMLHPDDRPKIMALFDQLVRGEIDGTNEEVRVRDGQGGWKWIRTSVILQKFDEQHNDVELIGVNFDITEVKEIEAKLIEAKNKAETLDKLKSAFLANMSHEIRTPLNAIVGFSNLLAEADNAEEQRQYISIIQENNDLLLQLISDVLDLSKIEAGTFEIVYGDVDVNVLCQEIVRSLSIKTAEGVVLELEHTEPECHMRGDRNRLMQIITNFINNALKFTTEGSIRLGYYIRGKEIEFYVSDTGIGIPARNLDAIFERFVKLNSFIHGTGLGLSICKSMVEQMGGRIGVDSEEGKGSRFWFILPLEQTEGASAEGNSMMAAAAKSSGSAKDKPVVLVAEDTESNFILVSTVLKKKYTIFWAHTGMEALEIYHREHPDIILMDVRMPELDGLETTRRIRQEDTQTPIIALTAFAFDSDKTKSLEAGCNAYLSKPVNAVKLKQIMEELLG